MKRYVCDTRGKWVHVVNLVAGDADQPAGDEAARTTATATVSEALEQATTTGGAPLGTRAQKSNGGSGSGTGCPIGDGETTAQPGETVVIITKVVDRKTGKVVARRSSAYICGSDGQWHQIAALLAPVVLIPSSTVVTLTETAR